MTSKDTLMQAMSMLAERPNALFIGQNLVYDNGTPTYATVRHIRAEQKIEMPVTEELQVGCCIGLSLQGFLPICIIERFDFMLRAADQIVNHLDKLSMMTVGRFSPKVIIRTRVGSKTPLNAGPQHTQDYTEAFRSMLTSVRVAEIFEPDGILPVYQRAMDSDRSTLIVENL